MNKAKSALLRGKNSHGLDVSYFNKQLTKLTDEAENYTPAEMARACTRLGMAADSKTVVDLARQYEIVSDQKESKDAPLYQSVDMDSIWIGAFRYYCGAATISTHAFCETLIQHLEFISDHALEVMYQDLLEAILDDDRDRKRQLQSNRLGHDHDRLKWQQVMAKFQQRITGSSASVLKAC